MTEVRLQLHGEAKALDLDEDASEELEPIALFALLLARQARGGAMEILAESVPGRAQELFDLSVALVEPWITSEDAACRIGCAACCSLLIGVTPVEAIAAAEYLRRARSPEELESCRRDVSARIDRTTGLDLATRTFHCRLPCPLLDASGHCGIYPVRPLACRGHNSLSATACEEDERAPSAHNRIPVDWRPRDVVANVVAGLEPAVVEQALDWEPCELAAALSIALDEPRAAERWASGERLFEPAWLCNRHPKVGSDSAARHLPEG